MKIVFLDAATMGDVSFKPFERLGEFVKFDSSTPEEARERVKDVDVLLIKEILGHENLATTEIYTHIIDSQLKDAVASNPLNNLSKNKDITE